VSGLDYYNARYYDPVSGVFLSADTVQGNDSGMNPYAYAGGNPITHADPSGQTPASPGVDGPDWGKFFWQVLVNLPGFLASWLQVPSGSLLEQAKAIFLRESQPAITQPAPDFGNPFDNTTNPPDSTTLSGPSNANDILGNAAADDENPKGSSNKSWPKPKDQKARNQSPNGGRDIKGANGYRHYL